jgi:predicted  nucleic acid-binding Zn-ribbon protein
MQVVPRAMVTLALLVAAGLPILGGATNPLAKTIDLMNELKAKVVKDGEDEAKAYHDYFEWCDDAATDAKFAIETATKKKEKLEAQIADLSSSIEASTAKIEDLASSISTSETELKDATLIREKEAAEFAASEKELVETLSALDRALAILEKEMAKNPASFAQVDTTSFQGLLQALSALVDAAALSGADNNKLAALIQSQQGSDSDDDEDAPGAPAAAVYKTHSGGILEVLEDLKDKAETQLSDLRKAESNTKHNFDMLKQSLEDDVSVKTKYMTEEKTAKAEAEEGKATAEGDLARTTTDLKSSQEELATTSATCMTVAADHEASVAARDEELKVIAEATKILMETSAGAVEETYSLVQVAAASKMQSRAFLARLEVVSFVKKLAQKHHSAALAQLASRIAAVARYGDDPFTKVKGLIQDMIIKLETEAQAAATEKAWCDEQMAKTEAKKSELDEDIAKLTTKIDQAAARSAQLKAEVKELQGELASLAKEQAEMDKIRQEANAAYVEAKADLELGLSGVQKALDVLRTYYGGSAALIQSDAAFGSFMQQPAKPETFKKATGAGDSIIGILEVVESDFSTNLAKVETEEADEASEYEKTTQENKVTKTTKDQDVKYKTQEFTALDKTIDELSADKESASAELASVMEYYGEVKERCIAKPETYEERQAKRQAEIKGLKEALSILENETAFVQRKRRHGHMRGALTAQ